MALIVYNKENSRPQEVLYKGKRTINLDSRGAAHIPLIHQIHSDRISIRLYAIPNQLVFRRDDNFNLPTRRKGKDKDAYIK